MRKDKKRFKPKKKSLNKSRCLEHFANQLSKKTRTKERERERERELVVEDNWHRDKALLQGIEGGVLLALWDQET